MSRFENEYKHIREGGDGLFEQKRGLIAVWGKEAVQFLDGMVTNDIKTLGDGQQILAAFPNAQGRLLAVVRILRDGDRFLLETEEATRDKVFQNLFRFTFAGDFFVDEISNHYRFFEIFSSEPVSIANSIVYAGRANCGIFIPTTDTETFLSECNAKGAVTLDEDIYEIIRIENGIPKYGVDMDETTVVPELGIDGLISYNKGCYIGQEIIARIYFRGHVAKRLTGLFSEPGAARTGLTPGTELVTEDGKNAGKITSATYSPKLERSIALAFVRYDHLAAGTRLRAHDTDVTVADLPFIS